MNKQLNWTESVAAEQIIHASEFSQQSDHQINSATKHCIDKAISLLANNIQDDSRYLLFHWDKDNATLRISVTDDKKQKDSQHVVQCFMSALNTELTAAEKQKHADALQYYIRDFLTTSRDFMQYSLVAVFMDDKRENSRLL